MSNGNGKLRIPRPVIDGLLIVLLLASIGVTGYLANESSKNSELAAIRSEKAEQAVAEAKAIANSTDAKLTKFIDDWWKRVEIGNKNTNVTQGGIKDLLNNVTIVLEKQLANEEDIIKSEENILGNLTDHRLVANETNVLTRETLEQQLKNERALHDDHKDIVKALQQLGSNITITNSFAENKTTEANIQDQLKTLLENLTNNQD